ncbi:MAG: hypothetical protein AAGJ91_10050 [Pseudomonadota bacterium]
MTIPMPTRRGEISHIDTLACDAFEQGLLPIARHFWLAISRKDSVAWHRAYSISAERYGERIGFPVGHQMAKLVRVLIDLRGPALSFHDPSDDDKKDHVTADEAQLVTMIHHMRRDDTPPARDAVDALTEGRMDPDLIRAALHLASRFPCGIPGAATANTQPRLYAVT